MTHRARIQNVFATDAGIPPADGGSDGGSQPSSGGSCASPGNGLLGVLALLLFVVRRRTREAS